MGLFSTVLHIYKGSQHEVVQELIKELRETKELQKVSRLNIKNTNIEKVLTENVLDCYGIFYLVLPEKGHWITIIELNTRIETPFYLDDLTNSMSNRLNSYALSFHLHDDDILLYNLDYKGSSIDGYNSNYQYFLHERAGKEDVLSQRHTPEAFIELIPENKNIDTLNSILNEGYWDAFDNDNLDEDGVPNDEKYFIDEQDRFERIGKFLELYTPDDYPFADWFNNLKKIDLSGCHLLKAE